MVETRREILARAVVNAWQNNEPYGLLLRELYQECGMNKEMADKLVRELTGK